jgi:hypothetical protein
MSVFAKAPNAFIVWLRQMRRSAWVLIGLYIIWRVGDAAVQGGPLHPVSGSPALAGGME